MDFSESDEQRMLREAVAKMGDKYGIGYFLERASRGEKTDALWRELGEAGFLGVNLPEAYGGAELGISELAIVCEELAAKGCPLLLLIVSPAICGSILSRFGTDEQKAEFLPPLADGSKKMAFAITEPNAGSNSHRISTVAEPDGSAYRISGTKYYISGYDEADHVLVVTKTGEDPDTGRGRLSLFIVDRDAPGLTASQIPVEITSPEKQFTLFFDQVTVGAERLVGREGHGLQQVFMGLVPERITGAAIATGIGLYALQKAARYANERQVWDVPIGTHQGIAHPLAQAKIEIELARLMTQKAAWLYDTGRSRGSDAGRFAGEAANIAKYSSAEASLHALDQAIQTHGGNGLASEYELAQLWGMARLLRTAPVSREMVLNYISTHTLGLPKSY